MSCEPVLSTMETFISVSHTIQPSLTTNQCKESLMQRSGWKFSVSSPASTLGSTTICRVSRLNFSKCPKIKCQNVWSGWPVYEVKCLCSKGWNEEGRGATPIRFSIFDSYEMKSLQFRFGHGIFSSFKIASL